MIAVARRRSPLTRFATHFILTYRATVSARLGSRCPFEPSCSAYGLLAYERYGFWTATRKTLGRLRRCNGRHDGSLIDPP
jgi:uncharacterized protein